MTWDLTLWCRQCSGHVTIDLNDVDSMAQSNGPVVTLEDIRTTMREHEVEVHGGKSR